MGRVRETFILHYAKCFVANEILIRSLKFSEDMEIHEAGRCMIDVTGGIMSLRESSCSHKNIQTFEISDLRYLSHFASHSLKFMSMCSRAFYFCMKSFFERFPKELFR